MACPVCDGARLRPFMQVDGRDYWRCDDCLATLLEPAQRPTLEAERREYRLHRNPPDDPGYRRFLGRLVVPLLARLAPGSEGLDYGCGPGPALAAMVVAAGHRMALYDPCFAPDSTVLARRYDFITCTEVIEHFHRPAAEFARLDALLRPGGLLAVMTCLQDDDRRFAGWHYRRDPTHVVFYREATLRRIAARHGWQCDFPARNVAFFRRGVSPVAGSG